MPRCEICHTKHNGTLYGFYKQTVGGFVWVEACPKCKEEHDKYLESLRQNFRAQFGDR